MKSKKILLIEFDWQKVRLNVWKVKFYLEEVKFKMYKVKILV